MAQLLLARPRIARQGNPSMAASSQRKTSAGVHAATNVPTEGEGVLGSRRGSAGGGGRGSWELGLEIGAAGITV